MCWCCEKQLAHLQANHLIYHLSCWIRCLNFKNSGLQLKFHLLNCLTQGLSYDFSGPGQNILGGSSNNKYLGTPRSLGPPQAQGQDNVFQFSPLYPPLVLWSTQILKSGLCRKPWIRYYNIPLSRGLRYVKFTLDPSYLSAGKGSACMRAEHKSAKWAVCKNNISSTLTINLGMNHDLSQVCFIWNTIRCPE